MKFLNYFLLSAFVPVSVFANTLSEEQKILNTLEEIFGDSNISEDDHSTEED